MRPMAASMSSSVAFRPLESAGHLHLVEDQALEHLALQHVGRRQLVSLPRVLVGDVLDGALELAVEDDVFVHDRPGWSIGTSAGRARRGTASNTPAGSAMARRRRAHGRRNGNKGHGVGPDPNPLRAGPWRFPAAPSRDRRDCSQGWPDAASCGCPARPIQGPSVRSRAGCRGSARPRDCARSVARQAEPQCNSCPTGRRAPAPAACCRGSSSNRVRPRSRCR